MARRLPDRFFKPDPEEVCQNPTCEKHRMLCKDCECCSDHCECPEVCPRCGGLWGPNSWEVAQARGVEQCGCLECIICHQMVHEDYADYGYGLSEEQAQDNRGCDCTVVCPSCVEKGLTPPPPSQRGFVDERPTV